MKKFLIPSVGLAILGAVSSAPLGNKLFLKTLSGIGNLFSNSKKVENKKIENKQLKSEQEITTPLIKDLPEKEAIRVTEEVVLASSIEVKKEVKEQILPPAPKGELKTQPQGENRRLSRGRGAGRGWCVTTLEARFVEDVSVCW